MRHPIAVPILTLALSLPIIITFEIIDATVKGIWIEHKPKSQWCEGSDSDLDPHLFIRERFNARSDYAYIIVGCWMVALGVNDSWNNYKKQVNNDEILLEGSGGGSNEEVSFPVASGEDVSNTNCNSSNSLPSGQNQEETATYLFQDNLLSEQPAALGEEPPLTIQSTKIPNGLLQFPYLTIVSGIIGILHGLGSFWNHACQCPNGGRADTAGMMGIIVFPIFYSPLQLLLGYLGSSSSSNSSSGSTSLPLSYSKKRLILKVVSLITAVGQTTFYVLALFIHKLRRTKNFEIIVYFYFTWFPLLLIYLKFWRNKRLSIGDVKHELKTNIILLGMISFSLGFLCWKLDIDKIWCFDKESQFHFLQGHAFWHVLTSVSWACLYLFYRTEELIVVTDDLKRQEETGRKDEEIMVVSNDLEHRE